MNKLPTLSLPLLLIATALGTPGAATAQKDRIYWTDGTVEEGVTVTRFTLREVEFRKRGATDSRSSDRVADLRVEKVRDRYRTGYNPASSADAPGSFLSTADSLKSDPFLAQFGYVEAFRLFRDNGQYADAFQCLADLEKNCPDSGFLPMIYREKLIYYLGRKKPKDAMTVANNYATATQTEGYPAGFVVEADYYKSVARSAADELTNQELRSSMREILQRSDANYPDVADKARLQIANTLLAENNIKDANQEFEELLSKDHAAEDVRAGAWLGLGYGNFKSGDPTNKDPYYQALLAFLRVYIETPNAAPSLRAESLYMGVQAAEKWGGEDAAFMRRRLERILRNEFPDSPWAKKG